MLFQWSRLEAGSIRLVRFLPYSSPGSLYMALEHRARYWEEGVHYTALSYVNGDRNQRKPITLAGRSFVVTANLYDALAAIFARGHGDRWFWVDQLCINHQSLPEKNAQIAQMGAIYASADQVVAWLRPDNAVSYQPIKPGAPDDVAVPTDQDHELETPPGLPIDMSAITQNSYWQRAWTRVEALRARKLEVMYGSCVVTHNELEPLHDSALGQHQAFNTLLQHCSLAESDTSDNHLDLSSLLSKVLREYSGCSTSNVLDRVFAMLNDARLERLPSVHRPRIDYGITAADLASGLTLWHDSLLQYETTTKGAEQASLEFSRLVAKALETSSG